jgi:hypothetical protein
MAWPPPFLAPARDSILTDIVLTARVLPSRVHRHSAWKENLEGWLLRKT